MTYSDSANPTEPGAPARTMLTALLAFFAAEDWPVTPLGDGAVLQMAFEGEAGRWLCFAQLREEQTQILFYSVCPTRVPPERRAAAAEFLTWANSGLLLGNFEMDYADGEVRYKTSVDTGGGPVSELLPPLVYANVLMMDRYLPGIMDVIGGADPAATATRIDAEPPT